MHKGECRKKRRGIDSILPLGASVRDIYFLTLILFSALLAGAAVVAKRNRKPIGSDVARLLVTTLLPILGNLVLLFSDTAAAAQAAYFLYLAGTNVMFLYLIRFTVNYCGYSGKYAGIHGALRVLTALDVLQIALNPVFGQAYHIVRIILPGDGSYFDLISGPGHVLHLILTGVYLVIVFTALLLRIYRTPFVYAEKYIIVLGAILFTTVWQFFSIFGHWQMDTSMIGYAICGLLIFFFSLYYKPAFLLWRMMRSIVSNLSNAILFFDMEGHCVYANQSALDFTGAAGESEVEEKLSVLQELFGFSNEDLGAEFERDVAIAAGRGDLLAGQVHGTAFRPHENCDCKHEHMREEGQQLFYHVEYHILTDRHGRKTGVFFSLQDRTEEERRSRRECYRASHDMMTGLYNRDGFCERVREILDHEQEAAGGKSELVAGKHLILVTNIRNFKMVNELFGKSDGDRVLREFVRMLQENAREDSILARLSGDRFGIFCRADGFDENRLEHGIHTVTHLLGDQSFPIITHVGIYEITQPELAITVMIDRATMAGSSIRGEYNQRIAYYDNNLRNSLLWEQKVVGELDQAIEGGQIVPYLQAQVNRDGVMEGAEVLVRWKHPEDGLISPGRFLPVLERNGQIAQVDRCIWEEACRILARWKKEGKENLYLSINISPKDFYFMDVYETITALVEKYGISPKNLRLEITETVMMDDMEKRLPLIERLREYGFLVEMDDFGSGYSSLNMLKDIPVDILKIDMVFLYKTKNPDKAMKILQLIIAMTEQLGIGSITEGVETKDQAWMLRDMGCHMFQGYYFSKPISLQDFEEKYLVA